MDLMKEIKEIKKQLSKLEKFAKEEKKVKQLTIAEAEFCAKYKNIQRTETLDLPTWEEAKIDKLVQNGEVKNGCWDLIKSFTDKRNNEMFEFSLSRDDYNQFYLSVNNEDSSYKDLFYKPLTYENYLEACELCKKLFEGEEL